MGGTILGRCAVCDHQIDIDPLSESRYHVCADCKAEVEGAKRNQIFEGYANFYDETMNHPFDKSLFLYPTFELALFYAEKAGPMKAHLIGGKPQRVRIEVLE